MNYIGSKYRLLPFLEESIQDFICGTISDKVFCDLFAGTVAVGRHFKTKCKSVIANDMEYYSYVLNRNYVGNHTALKADRWLEKLEAIEGTEGFIYQNY